MANKKNQPGNRTPSAGDLPFDESLLTAAEERYKAIKADAPGPGSEALGVLEAMPSGTEVPSRREVARRLLQTNPPGAISRRLRRIGLAPDAAESAAEAVANPFESFPDTESLAVEGTRELLGLERIIGRNELLGIQYLDGGQASSRSVARVVIRNGQGVVRGFGTGSLVSPRLLITNNHVLGSEDDARDSVVEFNFQDDLQGNRLTPVRFKLEPDMFFVTSTLGELDFTLVAVAEVAEDGTTPLSRFGFNPLGTLEGEILAGESLTIIQHPNGEPKQIALRENLVLKFPEDGDRFLHYQTDTTPGSSGSPVYNDQWEMVALHHSGFPRRDANGNILTTDGQIWKKSMGEQRIDWIANEGIRARAIVEHLKGLDGLGDARKALLRALLSAPAGGPVAGGGGEVRTSGPPQDAGAGRREQRDAVPPQPVSAAGGQAVWTIPLRVAVSLGEPVVSAAPGAGGPPPAPVLAGAGSSPPARRPAGPGGSLTMVDDETVRAAKAELERSRTRTYLDEAAEAQARSSYYRGLTPGGDRGQFFKALSRLLESTHTNRPTYAPTRLLYPWADLQPDKRIKSVYSGQEFDPLELIEADREVDRERANRLEAFRLTEAAATSEDLALQEALLEASLPYNCEHSVPQSWFGKKEPMRGDLHHLFACESGCNSFRGNTPYFDFREIEEVVRVGCGRREPNRFQPTAGMGAVARATLYFLLRYPGAVRRGSTTYTEDRITMLLGWHRENPVGKYERHRNQAIFEVQGNRNPLIDYPEWADKIDFLRGLG